MSDSASGTIKMEPDLSVSGHLGNLSRNPDADYEPEDLDIHYNVNQLCYCIF